ncbi:hypothetical protein BH11CYA1_BH11CYA1_23270 [soil metagenome]
MTAKIFEFKRVPASPMHTQYVLVQEAFNWACALQLRGWALSSHEKIEAATCITLPVDEQIARAQEVVNVKYDAQLAEQKARKIGETLLYRRAEFTDEQNFQLRLLHALEAEICAIEVQLLCAECVADAAERDGQTRPVGEFQFLQVKLRTKSSAAATLRAKQAIQDQPISTNQLNERKS